VSARAPEFRGDWLGAAVNAATTSQRLHLARRALRDWVIARPLSYGTGNAERSRAFTVLASIS